MEDLRIGVYVCWCGTNIAMMVDVEDVAEDIKSLPDVVLSKNYKYMCSDPGQDMIIEDIKEHNLNRIVVSACSPRIHELTFRNALIKAGLNPYMLEVANIREHVSWVHKDREIATKKAKALVAAAVNRVRYHTALESRSVSVNNANLVIGGGISGMTAALELADAGHQVHLLEKENSLGGNAAKVDLSFPFMDDISGRVDHLVEKVENHPKINTIKNAKIDSVGGFVGNFKAIIENGKTHELEFGSIIMATGLKSYDATKIEEYKYKKLPNIVNALEFEAMLKEGKITLENGAEPKNVAIIHCVGSRNHKHHEYCSRTCCMTGLKYANTIKTNMPETNVFELYADMRAIGKANEEFYKETARKGVIHLMFDQRAEQLPVVSKESNHMKIEFHELLSNEDVRVDVDMIILLTAMESHEDAKQMSHHAGISLCGNSFYIEKHPKLDPVATTTDGVYVVGSCQSPKEIPDSIAQSKAATARILATIERGKVQVEVTTAEINSDICCGCQFCISVCPYTAISFNEEEGVSEVNEALCKGCGTCGSACPSGAINSKHFTDQQIFSQIEGLMNKDIELKEIKL